MENQKSRKLLREYRCLEDVIGCKWSVSVLMRISEGAIRPGVLERSIEGISTKVLSERLRKLTNYGLLARQSFHEIPPRTEYSLTAKGLKLVEILSNIHALDEAMPVPVK